MEADRGFLHKMPFPPGEEGTVVSLANHMLGVFERHVPGRSAGGVFVCTGCDGGAVFPSAQPGAKDPIPLFVSPDCPDCCVSCVKEDFQTYDHHKVYMDYLECFKDLGDLQFGSYAITAEEGVSRAYYSHKDRDMKMEVIDEGDSAYLKQIRSLMSQNLRRKLSQLQIEDKEAVKRVYEDPETTAFISKVLSLINGLSRESRAGVMQDQATAYVVEYCVKVAQYIMSAVGWGRPEKWRTVKSLLPPKVPESFDEFVPLLNSICPLPMDGKVPDLRVANRFHVFGRWMEFGMPIFSLTHSLMASLMLTDPGSVPVVDVRPPFPTFFIRLPTPFWEIIVDDIQETIGGMWVHEYTHKGDPWLKLVPCSLEGGMPINQELIVEGKVRDWLAVVANRGHNEGVDKEYMRQAVGPAFRLYVNLCLYISELRTARPAAEKTRDRKSKGHREERPSTEILGREIKLDHDLLEAGKKWTNTGKQNRAEWHVHARFMIRGYWKEQVWGPRKKLPDGHFTPWPNRRHQWQKPFWKGTDGPALQHIYSMQGKVEKPVEKPDLPT